MNTQFMKNNLFSFNLDVTSLVIWVQKNNLPLFPVLLFLFARVISSLQGNIQKLNPCYTVLNDKNWKWGLTDAHSDIIAFLENYATECFNLMQLKKTFHSIPNSDNCFYVSCLKTANLPEINPFSLPNTFFSLDKLYPLTQKSFIPLTIFNNQNAELLFDEMQKLCFSFTKDNFI